MPSRNGFHYVLFGWIPLILAIAIVVQLVLVRFSTVKTPKLGSVTWGQVRLIAAGLAALLVLLRLFVADSATFPVVGPVDLDRKFGLFLAVPSAIALLVGALLDVREPEAAAAPAAHPPVP